MSQVKDALNKSIDIALHKALWLFSLIVYGVFSWGPKPNSHETQLSKLNLYAYLFFFTQLLAICVLSTLFRKKTSRVSVKYSEIILAFSVATFFLLTKPFLWNLRLSGDELFHTQSAIAPGTALAKSLIAYSPEKLSNTLSGTQFRFLVSSSQLIILAVISLFVYFLSKTKRTIIPISAFLLFSLICYKYIGFGYKYPSGYIIPQFIVSGIAFETIAFRFAQIAAISFVLIVATRSIRLKLGTIKYSALLLMILQVPVLSFNIGEIDQAVYFAFFAGLLMNFFLRVKDNEEYPVENIVISLCLLIMCRSSAILLLPMVFLPLIFRKRKNWNWKSLLSIISVLPILLVSFFDLSTGLIFKSKVSEVPGFTKNLNPINAFWESVFTEFDKASLLLLLFALSYLLLRRETRPLTIYYLLSFSTIYAYGIPVAVRGLNKYPFEIFSPLIIFAFINLLERVTILNFLRDIRKASILAALASVIFLSNSITFQDLEKNLDNWGQVPPLINYPIQVNVEEELTRRGLDIECKNLGATYGFFSFILNGVSYSRLSIIERNQLPEATTLNWGVGLVTNLDLSRYRCLVLDAYPAKEKIRSALRANGFSVTYKKTGRHFPTTTEIWQKSP